MPRGFVWRRRLFVLCGSLPFSRFRTRFSSAFLHLSSEATVSYTNNFYAMPCVVMSCLRLLSRSSTRFSLHSLSSVWLYVAFLSLCEGGGLLSLITDWTSWPEVLVLKGSACFHTDVCIARYAHLRSLFSLRLSPFGRWLTSHRGN